MISHGQNHNTINIIDRDDASVQMNLKCLGSGRIKGGRKSSDCSGLYGALLMSGAQAGLVCLYNPVKICPSHMEHSAPDSERYPTAA